MARNLSSPKWSKNFCWMLTIHEHCGAGGARSCGRKKEIKIIALDKAFPGDYEQAAAAGKPAPALGPGPAGNKRHRVRYRETK